MKPARTLFASSTVDVACAQRNEEWTRKELVALGEYVALYWDGAHTNGWSSAKKYTCFTALKQSNRLQVSQNEQVRLTIRYNFILG